MDQLRVGVIFGGRSGEHEVSLMSAKSVISVLKERGYDVVPMGITREGDWLYAKEAWDMLAQGEGNNHREITDNDLDDHNGLIKLPAPHMFQNIDVMFPVLHGTYGEDGTIQGLLELANLPYVGAGVAGSAVSMDKALMRGCFANAGLPMVKWETVLRNQWENAPEAVLDILEKSLGYPCFVKPANLGSSVGISKAKDRTSLRQALNFASEFDRRLVVEEAVRDPREIECSVLGNEDVRVSIPGEIVPGNEFYDYEAKYFNDNSRLFIPADITIEQATLLQDYAAKAYKAVDCAGMARVDFFIDGTGKVFINEINTIPGFTRISMYPKLWEASGLKYGELVETLIKLALERHQDRLRSRINP